MRLLPDMKLLEIGHSRSWLPISLGSPSFQSDPKHAATSRSADSTRQVVFSCTSSIQFADFARPLRLANHESVDVPFVDQLLSVRKLLEARKDETELIVGQLVA